MNENRGYFVLFSKSPLYQLIIALLTIIVIGGTLFIVLFISGLLFSGIDIESVTDTFLVDQDEQNINIIRYLLIIQDISLFIVPAIIIRHFLLSGSFVNIKDFSLPTLNEIVLVVLLAFCMFPLTGITGEFNSNMKFPEWLSGVEEWMRSKETEAAGLVDLLIPSDGFGLMIFNLFLVAALPAISEELIFRGVFQRILYGLFRSPYIAIWVTAFLFSALHLQFYGFVPRMILGLSFGYLYFWGRSIWLPILAHFVNNGVPVALMYLQGLKEFTAGPDMTSLELFLVFPVSVCLCVLILWHFRNRYYLKAHTRFVSEKEEE